MFGKGAPGPILARIHHHEGKQIMTQTTEAVQQPALTEAQRSEALAALVPATAAGMPPTAQTFYAVVKADGTLARGFEAVSATRLGLGMYQVLYAHDITGSAFVGT